MQCLSMCICVYSMQCLGLCACILRRSVHVCLSSHVLPCQLAGVCTPFYPLERGSGRVHNTSMVGQVPLGHGLVEGLLDADTSSSVDLRTGGRTYVHTMHTRLYVCTHVNQ